MKVLITGGAGYIGSHCNRYFNEQGIETVVVDDLSDGHEESIVAGKFIKGDFGDEKFMKELFQKEKINAVVHFAALRLFLTLLPGRKDIMIITCQRC
ncbi:NAD-dependent epimerase/dehydratase family protein [Phascolarctobacterium faecium]|uniref:NAD-dependent epimerase/dehydratase family protein n=1 Tax=Phascolarctobacterium faecium TaxID=33025 RepID=UPI001CA8DBBC|nr:NAD-dependent epimerase/dehydratase family protein [Phascolarctobacterium faecium]